MSNRVTVRFARKPSSLQEMMAEINSPGCEVATCEIAETAELTTEQYDNFTRLIYKDWPWLEGRGGDRNGIRQVVAITAPDRPTLYVNPEGSSYGRYVGLEVPPEMVIKFPDVHVRLTGEDGNAFNILGLCQRAAKRAHVPAEDIKAFMDEASNGDYNHLLVTCRKWFDCY